MLLESLTQGSAVGAGAFPEGSGAGAASLAGVGGSGPGLSKPCGVQDGLHLGGCAVMAPKTEEDTVRPGHHPVCCHGR